MAAFTFPDYVIERVMNKRGRLHVFERFEPSRTALIVVDMQNFYVAEVPAARAIVPNINRLAHAMRERGGIVAWVYMTAGAAGESRWSVYHDNFFTAEKAAKHRDSLSPGAAGHELWHELEIRPEDLRVSKTRFSAFIEGASDLDALLRARQIENLVVCGTATNFCCETTARDAMMRDYQVIMVSDGCAARYEEDHAAGLTSFYQSFGDVLATDDVLDRILEPRSDSTVTSSV